VIINSPLDAVAYPTAHIVPGFSLIYIEFEIHMAAAYIYGKCPE